MGLMGMISTEYLFGHVGSWGLIPVFLQDGPIKIVNLCSFYMSFVLFVK